MVCESKHIFGERIVVLKSGFDRYIFVILSNVIYGWVKNCFISVQSCEVGFNTAFKVIGIMLAGSMILKLEFYACREIGVFSQLI